MALPRGSYLRLLTVVFACATLPGCSKERYVLFINRFHEKIQVETDLITETIIVPANGYAFGERCRCINPHDLNGSIYTENGQLIRITTFTYSSGSDEYGDDFIVVEVRP